MSDNKRRNNLTQGSLARKSEEYQSSYAEIENNRVIKEIRLKKTMKKKKLGMVFKVVLVFSLALLVVYRYAKITEVGYEYNSTRKSLEDVVSENERINVNIQSSINLARIRDVAENKLNMKMPEEYQKVHIDVKKIDVTEMEPEKKPEEKGVIATVTDWIKSVLGFME